MYFISEAIVNYLTSLYGNDLTKSYQNLINKEPSQYIRINSGKISHEKLRASLKQKYGIECENVPGDTNIFKITDEKNLVGKTLEHILGYYYIQSFSSAIPPMVLNPSETDMVLDLCAAPGSKTTELGEIMNNKGTIVANEIQLDRLKSLVFNIDRTNQMNAGVTHFKGEQLSTIYFNHFDKILVDAPCSGLGIVQKKIEVNNWWTVERVKRLSELQLKLLVSAIKMLKAGGEIVYSTCTLTVEENELVIDKILKKYPVEIVPFEIKIPSRKGITFYENQKLNPALEKAKRILPWEADSDGFFIIKLKKTGDTEAPIKRDMHLKNIKILKPDNNQIKIYLKLLQNEFGIDENIFSDFNYIIKTNEIFFVDKHWKDPNPGLFERIGARFGTINKDDRIILNAQAAQVFSNSITKNNFEIKNRDELRTYLSGGIIKTTSLQKGQCAVMYENEIIGTAVFTQAGLKSQFPRSFRTNEIYLPN